MTKRSYLGVPLAALAAAVGLLACAPDSTLTDSAKNGLVPGVQGSAGTGTNGLTVPMAVKSITVALGAAQIQVGTGTTATAAMMDGYGRPVTDRAPIWTSSNAAVATVGTDGTVRGVASGTALIVATSGGVSGSKVITVAGVATQLTITSQPASATSGVPLPSAVTVQVRDALGAAVSGATNVVAASMVSGGGVLGGTISVSAVNGVATFSNLQIAGAGAQTLRFATPGLTAATSNAIVVSGAAALVPPSGEPSFNPVTQRLLFRDDFDSYTGFADAKAGGWYCTNVLPTQDFTTNPQGACQIISGGYDGTGKAARLVYDGVLNAGPDEGHAWSHLTGDTLAAKPGHTFYITYYVRINPGAGHLLDEHLPNSPAYTYRVQVKWLQLWGPTGRAEFDTSYQHCGRANAPWVGADGSGTMWGFFGNGGGNTACQAMQIRGPWAYEGQSQWHRLTHKYVTQSAPGARDGLAQMWYDGTLILSVGQGYCGVAVPGGLPTGTINPPHWCETEDMDQIYVRDYVQRVTLGSINAGPKWPFTIDYDHMIAWREP